MRQVATKTFNLDNNLALLRFYQFSPVSVKPQVVAKVLIKAMMQLPNQDFKSCITLVPERLQVRVAVLQYAVRAVRPGTPARGCSVWDAGCSAVIRGSACGGRSLLRGRGTQCARSANLLAMRVAASTALRVAAGLCAWTEARASSAACRGLHHI